MARILEGDTDAGLLDTTFRFEAGDTFVGSLSDGGDWDYVRAELSEDRFYRITLDPSDARGDFRLRLEQPGLIINTNFDAYGDQNAVTYFAPETSGTYFLGTYSAYQGGAYEIRLEDIGSANRGTAEQFARILTTEYWQWANETPGAWALWEDRTLTYAFSNMSEEVRAAVVRVFETYTYYTGISFVEDPADGDIQFTVTDGGSLARMDREGDRIVGAEVELSEYWALRVSEPGTRTEAILMHEIGHALGLGHAGLYNFSAEYGVDTTYVNDTYLMSIMSYFHPYGVTDDGAFWRDRPLSPMPADLVALDQLYGLVNVEVGDSVYGYRPDTAGPPEFDGFTSGIFALMDDGGTDTIDLSLRPWASNIDLREGGIVPAGGANVGMVITPGTEIENAIGGRGFDRIIGNDLDNWLRGGNGADTLRGEGGDDRIEGGADAFDLRDVILAGAGNDTVDGGYGNDEIRGEAGNDMLSGGFGADTVIGGTGADILNGGVLSDMLFGGDGNDFINGGFGNDRLNGGAGADSFFHLGVQDHGSDWVQGFNPTQDMLVFGIQGARAADFAVNFSVTEGAGGAMSESFVVYRPTGQILWALIDVEPDASLTIQLNTGNGPEQFQLN